MKSRRSTLVLAAATCVALAAASGCRADGKEEGRSAEAQAAPLPSAAPPGQSRRIEITVDKKGYHPPSAPARAGEALVLAFTRTADSECVREVIVQGKATELPLNKQVDIPVTMPTDGDLVFTCGMKMFEGRVAVAK